MFYLLSISTYCKTELTDIEYRVLFYQQDTVSLYKMKLSWTTTKEKHKAKKLVKNEHT